MKMNNFQNLLTLRVKILTAALLEMKQETIHTKKLRIIISSHLQNLKQNNKLGLWNEAKLVTFVGACDPFYCRDWIGRGSDSIGKDAYLK